jgi:pyrimidine operon attenuation protein/uracil phosphoribosyltransferase
MHSSRYARLVDAADAMSARVLGFYVPDDWSEDVSPRGVVLMVRDFAPHYAVHDFEAAAVDDVIRDGRTFEHQVEALSAFARSCDDAFLASIDLAG